VFSQHLEKKYVPYLSFVKFTDAWYGKLKHNKENFSFLINDLYTNSHFYFKKDSVLLNVDNIYNSQYKYRLKDTIAVGKDFFKVTRSNDLKTLYLNKVDSFKSVYYKSGDKIPDYEVTNLKNEEVGIKSFIKDKNYLLIEFWGTWCGPCLKFQPEIESFYAKNNNKIALLGVAVDKSVTTVKNYVDKKQLSWENTFIKLGTKNTFLDDLKIKGYPTIILLDKNQRLLFLGSGTKENLQIVEKMIKH
jgi:thiol-disulfide isomerase/thioredoxin